MLPRMMARWCRVGAISTACLMVAAGCGASAGESNPSDLQGGDRIETACYSFEIPDGYHVRKVDTEQCYTELDLQGEAGDWFAVSVPAPASGPQVNSLADAVKRANPQGKQTKTTVDGTPAVFAVHRTVPKSKVYSYDLEIFSAKRPYRDPNGRKTGWIKVDFSLTSPHDLRSGGMIDSFVDSFDLT